MSISLAKWTVICSFLCFLDNLLFALYFGHLPCWQLFELLPFLVLCCFCIRNFHCSEHRNKLVHQIVVTYGIEHSFRDVIIMISWYSGFHTLSKGFVSFHDACMLWFWNFGPAMDSSMLGRCFFSGFFELFLIPIDEADAFSHCRALVDSHQCSNDSSFGTFGTQS